MKPSFHRTLCLVAVATCLACRPAVNYPDPVSPRYAGSPSPMQMPAVADTLRVISFNIEYARNMRQAEVLLRTACTLHDPDIILLQEMTASATRSLAEALGMQYVYYPAIYNRIMRRDVGNAILSRFPITSDAKLILPSRSRYAKTQRIATVATVTVNGRPIRVYSTHLGTPADVSWDGRVTQLKHILDDALAYSSVIIGGDMNSNDIGRVAREAGYLWPTDTIPKSNAFGRLDHFFVRGLRMPGPHSVGTQRVSRAVSDHNPVWIRLIPP